jgi:hypothetical protein
MFVKNQYGMRRLPYQIDGLMFRGKLFRKVLQTCPV